MTQKTSALHRRWVCHFPQFSHSESKSSCLMTKYIQDYWEEGKWSLIKSLLCSGALYKLFNIILTNLWSEYSPDFICEGTKVQESKQTDHSDSRGEAGAKALPTGLCSFHISLPFLVGKVLTAFMYSTERKERRAYLLLQVPHVAQIQPDSFN